jgi:hypothetical protein
MPFKVIGSAVYKKVNNRWVKKQQCGSPASAQAALRLLNGIKHNPEFAAKVKEGEKK